MEKLLNSKAVHLIAIAIMFVLPMIYGSAAFDGKKLFQNDIIQAAGGSSEYREYYEKDGEPILWTNQSFSGMPTYQLGLSHRGNIGFYINSFLRKINNPLSLIWICSFSMYIILVLFKVEPIIALICSLGFGFSTFNLISIEAGHNAKINALAYFPGVLGGVLIAYRKKLWLGLAVTALFLNVHLKANHFQITYYLIFAIFFFVLFQLYDDYKKKEMPKFFKTSILLIVAALLAAAPNVSRIWTTYEYAEETIRGGNSELTKPDADKRSTGLDKEYAMSWSYGIMESFTMVIPYFNGGSSQEELDKNSNLAQAGINRQVLKNAPTYWGDQPFTSGPVYLGAVFFFLFVMAMMMLKGPIKWWIVAYSLFALMLAWGKNFSVITDFFFYNVPMFNKFRTPMMFLSVLQFTIPLAGALVLQKISEEKDKKQLGKKILYGAGISLGLIFVFGIVFSGMYDFQGVNDQRLESAGWPMDLLEKDRASMMRSDSFRSIIFIAIAGALLYLYTLDRIKLQIALLGLGLVAVVDLWGVGKRYVNDDNFESIRKQEQLKVPTAIDQEILKDKDEHFRVFNLTKSPFNDGITSFHHKSIGGYHAAKLFRYQELIERQLSKNNIRVLNMLNTKYYILPGQQGGRAQLRPNPSALGNAWFVQDVLPVDNADDEMNSLDTLNTANYAVMDTRYAPYLQGSNLGYNAGDKIELIEYHPDRMVYKANVSTDFAFAVFSEIYYEGGNNDWKSSLDGETYDHIRVNYLLRGMKIPKGEHEIVFEFKPKSWAIGNKVSIAGSFILVAFVGLSFFMVYREEKSKE